MVQSPELLGEDLLIITTEYNKFDKTKERLDLLAVDRNGKLVVVELKRDDSGKNVELQAIKYAAYCSTLTLKDVVKLRTDFGKGRIGGQGDEDVEKEVLGFINNDQFEKLDDKPRIMLVAKEFRPEVTASVLWLRKFGVDISCVKLTPYKIDEVRLALVSYCLLPTVFR